VQEVAFLSELGLFGRLLNVYVKAVIFLGSLSSKRHPHIDALLYTHAVNSTFTSALQQYKQREHELECSLRASAGAGAATDARRQQLAAYPPFMVYDHIDTLCDATDSTIGESQRLHVFLTYNFAEYALMLHHDQRLARIVIVAPDNPSALRTKHVAHLHRHLQFYRVELDEHNVFHIAPTTLAQEEERYGPTLVVPAQKPQPPTLPAAPVKPSEPAPVTPSEPAAVKPPEPAAPVVPPEPAAAVKQSEPAAPVMPSEPAAPVMPSEPAAPVKQSEPAAPVKQSEPAAPVKQSEPAAPVMPSEPAAPVMPSEPAAPSEPDTLDNDDLEVPELTNTVI